MEKISDLNQIVIKTLDINKAQDIVSIDLKDKSSMAEYMIIASGTSSRHLQSLSEQVLEKFKNYGIQESKIEGKESGEWKLVDGIDLIVHIFHPEKRKFYENLIKSNKTINLINHLSKNKKNEIFFLMGADNLISFHKWYKWKLISRKCNLIVFDRHGYKKKSLNSITYKRLNKKNLEFIEFNKVNISSSQLRKI